MKKKDETPRWWQRLLRRPIDLGVLVCAALWQPLKRYFYLTRRDAQGFAVWCVIMALTLGFKWGYPKWEAAHAQEVAGVHGAADGSMSAGVSVPTGVGTRPVASHTFSRLSRVRASSPSAFDLSKTVASAKNRAAARLSARPAATSQTRAASAASASPPTRAAAQAPSPYGTPFRKKAIVVDLNLADTIDLQEVRGIGPAYARRIVAYRDRLGGFVHKAQLMEVWGIDSAAYHRIEPGVVLNSPPLRLLNINQLSIQELKKHPYLDYYQAKEIVRHREQYGAFENKSDLKKVNLIDADTYRRIAPYLSVAVPPAASAVP